MRSPLKDKFLQRAFFVWGDTNTLFKLLLSGKQFSKFKIAIYTNSKFKTQNSKFKNDSFCLPIVVLLPFKRTPFALKKDPFCSPKGLVLQPKRTPFQNDRTEGVSKLTAVRPEGAEAHSPGQHPG